MNAFEIVEAPEIRYSSYIHRPRLLKVMPSREALVLNGLEACPHCVKVLVETGRATS